jgi:methyltransferase (TIGR00027 family)
MTVSDTAQPIAWVRSREAELPTIERLFDDPYAHLFVGAGARSDPARAMLSLPFFATAVRLRTRYLDDAVRAALTKGHRQVVLLGAGFDCRGLRLPELATAGARVFEVDFGEQLEHKRRTLDAAGMPIPAAVRYVPCDFASPALDVELPAGLADAGFEPGAGTLFLWEGVVGYLDDAAVDQTLRLVTRLAAPRVQLALNYQLNRFLPGDFATRCATHGLTVVEDIDGVAAHGRYLRGEPPEEATLFRFATASGER